MNYPLHYLWMILIVYLALGFGHAIIKLDTYLRECSYRKVKPKVVPAIAAFIWRMTIVPGVIIFLGCWSILTELVPTKQR